MKKQMKKKLLENTNSSKEHDTVYMRLALEEAEAAFNQGEVPIGAVVIEKGEIIGRGHNSTISFQDPTAHAEMLALRQAAELKRSYRLSEAILYVTAEPCLMCLGAALHARVRRLVYGAEEPKFGAIRSLFNLTQLKGLNHKPEIAAGILAEECAALLRKFFQQRR
jgi:tRNA(adenine34) deaminase